MAIKQNIKVTVDAVIFSTKDKNTSVLLVRRKNEPFKGQWVLPGGFVDSGETLEQAARRELEEETCLKMDRLKQLKAFGNPGRDPRGQTVTIAYWGSVNKDNTTVRAASDADEVGWHNILNLPKLGFDHSEILNEALKIADIE